MVRSIGVFGLGLLGTAVAERLLAAGHDLLGHDPDPARTAAFAALGGRPAPPAEVAAADLVLACLPHSGVTRSLIDVLRDSWRPGQLFLDHTTGDPADAEELGAWFAAREVGYGDATVVGSSAEVAAANAVILMGGTLAVVESARPVLRCYARQVHAVGPVGAGATLKLVVNLVLGLHRAVLAEGLSLAADCGFEPADVLAILADSAAYSRVMDSKGPRMVSGDFAPVARLAQHRKDVALIQRLAARVGGEVPLTVAHAALLDRALALGCGELDNSAVIRAYGELSRRPPRPPQAR